MLTGSVHRRQGYAGTATQLLPRPLSARPALSAAQKQHHETTSQQQLIVHCGAKQQLARQPPKFCPKCFVGLLVDFLSSLELGLGMGLPVDCCSQQIYQGTKIEIE